MVLLDSGKDVNKKNRLHVVMSLIYILVLLLQSRRGCIKEERVLLLKMALIFSDHINWAA
jgi:hypothetical protein